MSHTCSQNYLHIIFATKNRRLLIPLELENRLYGYIQGIAKQHKSPIIQINGVQDHIHILLKLHPSTVLSVLIKEIKAYSTSWIKKQDINEFSWQEGYGAFSTSINHIEGLIKYIQNQKNHHKTKSFKEEIQFLNKIWGVEWMQDEFETEDDLDMQYSSENSMK
ncbi:MAG: IS200/IS605 family transposase [Parachlamydiaceae bacterium]|nr:IS200/IS605 family transposase [Parachlamydiaceae bacterium]